MKLISIPKRGKKGTRLICVPSPKQKGELRSILYSSLNQKQLQFCDKDVTHGFVPTKSIITLARKFIGCKFVTHFDIKDFFDSVTIEHVKEYLTEDEISKCFINGHAYQGLPTSSSIANLAIVKMVAEIKDYLSKIDDKVVFGIYADDVNVGHDNYLTYSILKEEIPKIINKYGFSINEKKTRLQDSRFGKLELCGIMVDDKEISTSRRFRRKLRAARFQESESARGMQEFALLKLPNPSMPSQQLENLLSTAIYYNNKAILKNYNDLIIVNELKPTIERIQNIKLDPTRRNKNLIKETVKKELNRGVIKKEDLIRVSKLKANISQS